MVTREVKLVPDAQSHGGWSHIYAHHGGRLQRKAGSPLMQQARTFDLQVPTKWDQLGSSAPTGQMRAQRQAALAGNAVVLKPQKAGLQTEPLAQLGQHCSPEGVLLEECCLHRYAGLTQVMMSPDSTCCAGIFNVGWARLSLTACWFAIPSHTEGKMKAFECID